MGKITTGKVRLSYANLFKPRAFAEGGEEKYSVVLLIPKTDKAQVQKIKDEIDKTIRQGLKDKWDNSMPKRFWNPLQDGDEEKSLEHPEYKGMYFLNAKSDSAPVIVDRDRNEILDATEVYSGCYARASITFYPFGGKNAKTGGNSGIGVGLNGIQKLADGEALGGGRINPDEEFGDDFEDDDDLLG